MKNHSTAEIRKAALDMIQNATDAQVLQADEFSYLVRVSIEEKDGTRNPLAIMYPPSNTWPHWDFELESEAPVSPWASNAVAA